MSKKDLLIEIGTEELPPKSLKRLGTAFADEIAAGLEKHGLAHGDVRWYATPRRLAVGVAKLATAQKDQKVEKRGPALSAAYDENGKPTKAAEGFARSCNAAVADLDTLETDKGKWLVYRTVEQGRDTANLLPEMIRTALARLPVARRMRWGDSEAEFVRPVHWSVVLLGRDIVPCDILGTSAGNETCGHRFHHPKPIRITSAATYAKKLRDKGHVMVDFNERRQSILQQVLESARAVGGHARIEDDLLDEVTALVEWPAALAGSFDEAFLELPREVLIATLQDHQRYFPVTDETGENIRQYFITVANIDSREPEEVRRGNERVIRPRLADAAFFWRRDCAVPLEDRRAQLGNVVFQKQLGTLKDKTRRISQLAASIADSLGLDSKPVQRAAELARCDLFTDMVGEFPELQGVMGRYYAERNGEPPEVALALDEQYMPRFAGDAIPASATGRVLAVAEKLDTLIGIFAIGQAPTGDRDPFGLRRAALGCLRIIIEGELDLDLEQCLKQSAKHFDGSLKTDAAVNDVFDFCMERLRRYYLDEGIHVDVFEAVLDRRPTRPLDFHHRIRAVTRFKQMPEAESLAAANKRIRNILRQSGETAAAAVKPELLREPAEQELAGALETAEKTVRPLLDTGDYQRALTELARLREPVDAFFDNVMVMCEDPSLKTNRLAMLQKLGDLFLSIADISRLQVEP
ncbi:MAG: glycine--tRNA ligase subunit beta [Gammaproteobacteria bacterium]